MDGAEGGPPIRVGALVGPTAVGKSALALAVARRIGAELLSADSTAVYRGMDIGTDKPRPEERRLVRYHLLDLADPDDTFNVARYREAADRVIHAIAERGGKPLLVGGSGLYVRAVLQRYAFGGGPANPERRAAWLEEWNAGGPGRLLERLRELDPAAARDMDPRNPRRLVRALERAYHRPRAESGTGDGPSRQGTSSPGPYESLVVGLTMDRARLHRRIEERVDRELGEGLVDEVRRLLERYPEDLPAFSALGYKEVIGFLRGRHDLPETRRILVRNTRRFARRQYTWFRREPGIVWLDLDRRPEAPENVLVLWFDRFFRCGIRPAAPETDPAP